MRILVVNAGSSSLKLRVVGDGDEVLGTSDAPAPADDDDGSALAEAIAGLGPIDAVGHRVVHGGTRFQAPVRIDAGVLEGLRELVALAPLHQPKALAAYDAVRAVLPGVPAVACFDTAFHATLAPAAATYPLPAQWRERFGLRRYGFHGLSHAYVARRAGPVAGLDAPRRIVSCHLGAGASLTAIRDGRSVDTTMGFTPLEGVVMATRSGSVDPGLLLWLLEHGGLDAGELGEGLERESGLLALAGTADMRDVQARAEGGDAAADAALEVYAHRLRAGIAAMAAAMDGIDVLAFTGGIGARSPGVRADAARGLAFLGVAVHDERNREADGDADVSAAGAAVRTVVIADREDLEIARGVRRALA
jgi:acetate kinase